MDRSLLLIALLATVALGAWLGFRYLGRAPRRQARQLHWMVGVLGFLLVVAALRHGVATRQGLTAGLLVALALTLGAASPLLARHWSRAGAEAVLVLHVFLGIAGTLVAISWARGF